MQEYEEQRYRSFNDFFIRKFRPGARSFAQDPHVFPEGLAAVVVNGEVAWSEGSASIACAGRALRRA